MATLSLTVASCDFCSSDRRFASAFLQIPLALIIVVAMKRTPLVLAVSFPLLGQIRDFHPLATCAARRTIKAQPAEFFSVSCAFFSSINHLFINDFCCSVANIIHLSHPQHHIFCFELFCNLLLLGDRFYCLLK